MNKLIVCIPYCILVMCLTFLGEGDVNHVIAAIASFISAMLLHGAAFGLGYEKASRVSIDKDEKYSVAPNTKLRININGLDVTVDNKSNKTWKGSF